MFTPRTPIAAIAQLFTTLIVLGTGASCATSGRGSGGEVVAVAATADVVDSAVFVTRLGVDTMAVERVVYGRRQVEADVLLRVPATTRTRYVLDRSDAGELTRMEAITQHPLAQRGPPTRVER